MYVENFNLTVSNIRSYTPSYWDIDFRKRLKLLNHPSRI